MLPGGAVSLNLVLLILLVVPGLLGVKAYLKSADQVEDHTRIDAVVYSIVLSIASIYLLYLAYWVYDGGLITLSTLQDASTPRFLLSYPLLVLVSVVVGKVYGRYQYHIGNNDYFDRRRDILSKARTSMKEGSFRTKFLTPLIEGDSTSRETLWEHIFRGSLDSDKVTVVTKEGERIHGTVLMAGTERQSRDILIAVEEQSKTSGDYAYIHDQDISQILFDDLSPRIDVVKEEESDDGDDLSNFEVEFSPDDELLQKSISELGIDPDDIEETTDVDEYFFNVRQELEKSPKKDKEDAKKD